MDTEEKRITSEEFFRRCEQDSPPSSVHAFIGNTHGLSKCRELVANLDRDFQVMLEDNPAQPNYSPTLWLKPLKHRKDRFTLNDTAFVVVMRLKPDECHLMSDGFIRLWWD